jgi:Tfp pilus assembly major pilin PilA
MLGFMLSVAVLFIVGTLAVNIYKDNAYKAYTSDILTNITDIKTRFHEHYAYKNAFPNPDEVHNYFANTDSMTYDSYEIFTDRRAKVTGAAITISIKHKKHEIDGRTITFTALQDSSRGTVVWLCGYASHQDYPFAGAHNKTTLKREYLPEICRD